MYVDETTRRKQKFSQECGISHTGRKLKMVIAQAFPSFPGMTTKLLFQVAEC